MRLKDRITRYSPIGLDLGGRSIKAVQLAHSGKRGLASCRLHAAVTIPQPEINQPLVPQTARYVRDALARQGFVGDQLVLAAPFKQLEVDVLELPPRSSGAPVEQIARSEIARTAKLENDSFEVESWDLPGSSRGSSGTSVMAVAMRHSDAASLLGPFESEGFDVVAIDTQAWALARACGVHEQPGTITAVLEIGWNAALICLLRDKTVIYQRMLSEAGTGIVLRAIRETFGLADDEAEYLLHRVGVSGAVAPELSQVAQQSRRISELVERHLDATIDQIDAAFSYARHRYADAPVQTLLLSGGGSMIAGIGPHLSSRLSVSVGLLSPAQIVQCSQNPATRSGDGTLTVALGLAAYEMD